MDWSQVDQRIRRLLRDGSPQECYVALMRVGHSENEIRDAISGKISRSRLGSFEQVQVDIGIKSLRSARLEIANRMFAVEIEHLRWDGNEIGHIQSFWDIRPNLKNSSGQALDLDGYERPYQVYLQDDLPDEEEERVYHVDFYKNSTIVHDDGSITENNDRWFYSFSGVE